MSYNPLCQACGHPWKEHDFLGIEAGRYDGFGRCGLCPCLTKWPPAEEETTTGQTESVRVPLADVETIVDWWRSANEAPGGCSASEAIAGMTQSVWNMESARRQQFERTCPSCGRTMSLPRPCPFCGAEING